MVIVTRLRVICLWLGLVIGVAVALAAEPTDWVEMFNGKTLEGWTQKNGFALFESKDGFIGGVSRAGSPVSYLCTLAEYDDFELELEVRISGNVASGVQVRSQTRPESSETPFHVGRVFGPQVRIAKAGDAGYLYYESEAGYWLTPESQRQPHQHFDDRDWNRLRVVARGPRIQTFLNDQLIDDFTDQALWQKHPKGFVGLQVAPVEDDSRPLMMWRKLRIRSLR